MEKHLHIVSLDVPYPLNYGGVFDLFCKLQYLQEAGVKIHLHCFEYGRGEQPALNQYCEEVKYYPRHEGHKGFSTCIPYIVASRSCCQLIEALQKDDHPVLLEGIHCTYPLYAGKLENRKVLLRLHNVEFEYYQQLYKHENSLLKKAYCYHEAKLLRNYEAKIANKATIATVSEKDKETYEQTFCAKDVHHLPVFIPFEEVKCDAGIGTYCLYHGNLSVAENEKAAIWLLENVFHNMKVPFIIAGKNPSARLEKIAHQRCHTCLVGNPDDKQMHDLIARAQINILPSFNETGIKLKLLNALFNGRHCIVNDAAIEKTGFESACHIGTTANAMQELVAQLYHLPFGEEEIRLRESLLLHHFNNRKNAKKLTALIW